MTRNEAIEKLAYTKRNCGMPHQGNKWKPNAEIITLDIAIKALEDVQQYRTIGTVEEIKEMLKNNDQTQIKCTIWKTLVKNMKGRGVYRITVSDIRYRKLDTGCTFDINTLFDIMEEIKEVLEKEQNAVAVFETIDKSKTKSLANSRTERKAVGIRWDIGNDEKMLEWLSKEIEISENMIHEEEISNYLFNQTGFWPDCFRIIKE